MTWIFANKSIALKGNNKILKDIVNCYLSKAENMKKKKHSRRRMKRLEIQNTHTIYGVSGEKGCRWFFSYEMKTWKGSKCLHIKETEIVLERSEKKINKKIWNWNWIWWRMKERQNKNGWKVFVWLQQPNCLHMEQPYYTLYEYMYNKHASHIFPFAY